MSKKPIVLVTGATGTQGGAVVTQLLKSPNQWSIRALTRNTANEKAKALEALGVEVVKGDLTDVASLDAAFVGVHSAFLITTPMGSRGTEGETADGKAFVDAAKRANVKHLVFTSVDSAGTTEVPHFLSKFAVEEHLRASGLSYTILGPTAFMDNFVNIPAAGRFALLGVFATGLAGKKVQLIAVSDIAWFAVEALNKPEEYNGKQISLAGDDLSVEEIVDVFERVDNVRPWKAWIPGLMLSALPFDVKKMLEFFRETGYGVDIPKLRKMHPGLLSFEDYLRQCRAGGSA